jgi:hypothetical protein
MREEHIQNPTHSAAVRSMSPRQNITIELCNAMSYKDLRWTFSLSFSDRRLLLTLYSRFGYLEKMRELYERKGLPFLEAATATRPV